MMAMPRWDQTLICAEGEPLAMCASEALNWGGESVRCFLRCAHAGNHAAQVDLRDPRRGMWIRAMLTWENKR